MREVPTKNYIILSCLAVGVIVISLILSNVYRTTHKEDYTPIIKEVITEIKYDDLDNYLQENLDVVLYINDSSVKSNRKLEKKVKKIITDNGISRYFVYIEKDKELIEKYKLGSNTPIFIAYQNGIITEVLNKKNCTIEDVEEFLILNKVIDSD